eukprot:tig00020710_g13330.t1
MDEPFLPAFHPTFSRLRLRLSQKKRAEERARREAEEAEEAAKAGALPRAEEACNVLRLALARKYAGLVPAILDRGGREIGAGEFDVAENALGLALEIPGPTALPIARKILVRSVAENALGLALEIPGPTALPIARAKLELKGKKKRAPSRRILRGLAPRAPATREQIVAEALRHTAARGRLDGVQFLVEAAGARDHLAGHAEECIRAALAAKHGAVAGYILVHLLRINKRIASVPGIAATAVRAASAEKLEALIDKEADVDVLVSERDEDPSAPAREMHLIAYALLKGGPPMAVSVAQTGPRSLLKLAGVELAGVEALARPYEKGEALPFEKATRAQRAALQQLCFQALFAGDWRLRLYSAAVLHVLETDGAEVPLDLAVWTEEMVAAAGRRLHGPTRDALVPVILRAAREAAGKSPALAPTAKESRRVSEAEAEEQNQPQPIAFEGAPVPKAPKRKAESKGPSSSKKGSKKARTSGGAKKGGKKAKGGEEEKEEEEEDGKEEEKEEDEKAEDKAEKKEEEKEEKKEEEAEEEPVKVLESLKRAGQGPRMPAGARRALSGTAPEGLEELAPIRHYAGLHLASKEALAAFLAELSPLYARQA